MDDSTLKWLSLAAILAWLVAAIAAGVRVYQSFRKATQSDALPNDSTMKGEPQ